MTDHLVVHRPEGSISVTPSALSRLVVRAAQLAHGVRVRRPRRGVEVALGDGRASVSLQLAARYGAVLPQLAREVQEHVTEALERMCGLEVEAVNVVIEELDE